MSDNQDPKISLKEIWPQERDFMARPDRWKYVRKIVQPTDCVFCQARDSGVGFAGLCLFKSENAMVVLNKYPYNSGHILVIPTKHLGKLSELSKQEYHDLSELLRRSSGIIQEVYECAGMNIGLNHGKVAGAGIPDHLHWHIVPRWTGDTNFFPLIAETKVLPESLEQSYEKLAKHFSGLTL